MTYNVINDQSTKCFLKATALLYSPRNDLLIEYPSRWVRVGTAGP